MAGAAGRGAPAGRYAEVAVGERRQNARCARSGQAIDFTGTAIWGSDGWIDNFAEIAAAASWTALR